MSLPLLRASHSSHLQRENIVNSVKGESQKPMVPLTHIHSHTQYMLFIYKLSFNMEPVKGSSVQSDMNGLCSVLITEWEDLCVQKWVPLSEEKDQGCFNEKRNDCLRVFLLYHELRSISLRDDK